MASRAEELRKLAARVTTAAGDVSAVSGTSISEILDFMRTNLNIVDGKLKVSAIKGPPVNLLSAPIIIQDTTVKYENNFDFVLTSGKTCTLEGYYTTKTGETYTFKHSVVPTDEIGARSVLFQDTPVNGNFDLGVRITLFSKDEGYTTVTIRDNSYVGTYVNYIEITSITEA